MCFSAGASFTASGALAVMGGANFLKVKEKKEYSLALVPVFFALQQFLEGMVWLSIGAEVKMFTVYGFLFFALIVWPFWVPLTTFLLEKEQSNRRLILPFLIIGGVVSICLMVGLFFYDISVEIFEHHIRYGADIGLVNLQNILTVLYVMVVSVTPMLSSIRFLRNAGVVILGAYLVAGYFYNVVFVSVWCFFAAILSLGVCWYFWRRK